MLLVTKLRNDNEKDDDDTGNIKNSIMMMLFTITTKMRIVTNEMRRKRSKFDARMSMQQEQDGLGVKTMTTVLTKEMYKMNRREQCASKQNDDDKGKE